MLEKIGRVTIIVLFASSGLLLGHFLTPFVANWIEPKTFDLLGLFSIPLSTGLAFLTGFVGCGILGYICAPFIIRSIYRCSEFFLSILSKLPTSEIVVGATGLIIALILADLLGNAVARIPFIGQYLPLGVSVVFGIVGVKLALSKKQELVTIWHAIFRLSRSKQAPKPQSAASTSKILDTSVVIDGRITDICKTGFIEGTLIVPNFVLDELQRIADSSDALKRNRGRRGLDVLQELQKADYCKIEIVNNDFDDLSEVDAKLVRLGQEMGAWVITNDYNLNKVAELQGVRVLNINELANAVKTAVLPGEEMVVHIVKEGKELNQGVAYLNDGTMIVVEGARTRVGETLEVAVTSVLQTAAGRMIFAKLKTNGREA